MTGSRPAVGILVLDTNILIALAKLQLDADSLTRRYGRLLVSFVSYTEALGFNFPNPAEERRMELLLASLEKIPFGEAEAQYAIAYRKTRPVMKFPDAAILATARAAGADLLTENTRDFAARDPAVRVLSLADLAAL